MSTEPVFREPVSYPVQFDVDYPDRPLNRLTTFFRPIVAIPIVIVLATVAGAGGWSYEESRGTAVGAGGVLVLGPLLMILFRERYPRWWFDWNQELLRFMSRVAVYLGLLDDRYPSTEDRQAVRLDLPWPDVRNGDVHRALPLVKWLLAIPHYIVLAFLWLGVLIALIIAWFAILFTGRFPRSLFDFVVGVGRWHLRVVAYAFVLCTDQYPPFRLAP